MGLCAFSKRWILFFHLYSVRRNLQNHNKFRTFIIHFWMMIIIICLFSSKREILPIQHILSWLNIKILERDASFQDEWGKWKRQAPKIAMIKNRWRKLKIKIKSLNLNNFLISGYHKQRVEYFAHDLFVKSIQHGKD